MKKVKFCGSMVRAIAYVEDGIKKVRVWDSVAGYYTTCHSLTAAQIKYVHGRKS